ncbi:hypothetical protein CPC08DRAFT_623499 [Agrocybe pediades]|nr:hypothetical protein CPC08DRAFT_623499 [Agrocybe pediades]
MAPRRRCPTCGSKQWHKEPTSGLIACSEGHVLQNYRNETTEITEFGPHARKKRALKTGNKKKGKVSNADPKLYHGARGRYHYFLCLQLIFRKQILALTQLWDLPPEFEVICRDLWALNLALLPDPPPAEPYHHAQESLMGEEQDSQNVSDTDEDEDVKSVADGDEQKLDDVTPEEEEEEEEEDPELEALMRENSDISDSSDEGEDDEARTSVPKKKHFSKGKSPYESLASTIAVLVVACWTMRIPVMYQDFARIIESYELPYLESTLKLPPSMVQHLTKHNVQALTPPHGPSTLRVHSLATRLAKKLNAKYGVHIPECNAASMLWRITKDMGGTPVLYRLTKRLASALSVPLTLHWTLSPGLVKIKGSDPSRHRYDNAPPEVGLLASLIIVTKLVYGLDGQPRQPEDGQDVGCSLVSETEYLRRIKKEMPGMRFDSRKNMHVGDMKPEEVEEYISFCSRILGGSEDETVLEYFGKVWKENKRDGEDRVENGEERGRTRVEEGTGVRPGVSYKIWNSRDVDGVGAVEIEEVIRRGSVVGGISVEYLGGVIEMFERRLMRSLTSAESRDRQS